MKNIFRVAVVLAVTVSVFGAGYVASAKPITALLAQIWGAGTPGQIPKFTSQTTIADSVITEDAAGNVGIGTAAPAVKLHVTGGKTLLDGNVAIGIGITTPHPNTKLHIQSSGDGPVVFMQGSAGNQLVSLYQSLGNGQIYANDRSGTVKVKIDSAGDSYLAGHVYVNDRQMNRKVMIDSEGSSYFTGGNVGIGTADPMSRAKLNVVATDLNMYPLYISGGPGTDASIIERKSVNTLALFNSRSEIGQAAGLFFMLLGNNGNPFSYGRIEGGIENNSLNTGFVGISTSDGTNNLYERMRISSGGNVGIGTTNPRGRMHIHDGIGGYMFWTSDIVDGTVQTIIPDGPGDVLYRVKIDAVVRASDGFSVTPTTSVPPGESREIASGLVVFVNSDGSVSIQRTSGTLTYKVAISFTWL